MKIFNCLLLAVAVSASAASAKPAAKPAKVNEAYTWDLTVIFASEAEWRAGIEKVKARLPELDQCRGKLGESAKTLKKCLDLSADLQKEASRVASWASLQKAVDNRNAANVEHDEVASNLMAKLGESAAFILPELTALGREKIAKLESKSDDLKIYHQQLRVIADAAEHILDSPREELLASLSPILYGSADVQQFLMTSDIEWKKAVAGGKSIKIDQAAYTKFRTSGDRAERARVFNAFYESLGRYERTMGTALSLSMKRNVITAKTRKYGSALLQALGADQIPEGVYRTLVAQVNEGLPVLHDYLNLMKKRMGLKTLEFYDSYAPGVKWDAKFPIADARKLVTTALAPLGEDYVKKFSAAVNARWDDVYPHDGKRGGAFMDPSVYEVHPFVFLNHQDDFDSTSTLAHEWGHAMHSVYTNESQPYIYANYATFIAEIASTTNEILLNDYMIKHSKSAREKEYYLEALLDMIRTTFFRQTQFGEFELALHEELEKGNPLSGQKISEIYGGITRKYYGHDKGVMIIDKKYFHEWQFVPHFYGAFYVYQYATSFSAGVYFASQILANKPGALENYLKVLKSGSSKYPTEILMDAGVDMTKPDVYRAVVEMMKTATTELRATRK